MDTNFINVTNRGLGSADDLVTIGELQRTPAIIPSRGPAQEAVVVAASTVGSSPGAFDDLRAQFADASPDCEPMPGTREQALRTNEEIAAHNEALDQEISGLVEEERYLRKLFSTPLATGDGCLTYGELIDLSQGSDQELADAATWLMGAFEVRHALPRKPTLLGGDRNFEETGFDDGGGIDIRAAQSYVAQLARRRRELEGQYQKPVEVPDAASTTGPAGDAGAGGTSSITGAAFGAAGVAPGDGTLGGALANVGDALAALQAEVAAESAKLQSKDPKVAEAAQKRLAELQPRVQALTSAMSILSAMMSNIAKVYSDMAMNAVRNMK